MPCYLGWQYQDIRCLGELGDFNYHFNGDQRSLLPFGAETLLSGELRPLLVVLPEMTVTWESWDHSYGGN